MRWFKDSDFIRGEVPMTKYEIRVLISSMFDLERGKKLLEIGSGTGSLTCQLAEAGFEVTTIEFFNEAIELTEKNLKNLNISANVIHGKAPLDLPKENFDACFIGGSRGGLEGIFEYLDEYMESGTVVASFIKIDNLSKTRELMNRYGYANIETRLIQVSHEDKIGLLRSENPIFILKGDKQ